MLMISPLGASSSPLTLRTVCWWLWIDPSACRHVCVSPILDAVHQAVISENNAAEDKARGVVSNEFLSDNKGP